MPRPAVPAQCEGESESEGGGERERGGGREGGGGGGGEISLMTPRTILRSEEIQ